MPTCRPSPRTGSGSTARRSSSAPLARWTTPDPLADKNYSTSPYAFCNNNPVNYVDPDGREWYDAAVGYAIGFTTNIVPGIGSIRDQYTPSDASDYNAALRIADNVSTLIGAALQTVGNIGISIGATAASIGTGAAMISGGTLALAGATSIVVGAEVAATGVAATATGTIVTANATLNKNQGYDRGKYSNDSNASFKKSGNQLQKDIEKGKAPKSINRYDIGKGKHEKPHVHFKDGNALNQDGTWKHGGRKLTNKEKKFLEKYDWKTE